MKQRTNIILDLDQTIISSEYVDRFDKHKYSDKIQQLKYVVMPNEFIIFQRPHLQEFLDYIFKHFNVSVWTAASRDYGLFIIEKFILTKPERQLDFFFYSYHCNYAMRCEKKLKPLSMLWKKFQLNHYSETNTMIVDDNYDVYKIQPNNTYMIHEFNYEDPLATMDTHLLKLMRMIKNQMKHTDK